MKRRSFLQLGALTSVAPGFSLATETAQVPTQSAPSLPEASVKRYVTLGRTGLSVSDISFGSSRLRPGQEDLVNYAIDRGVNYIDTAESYTGGDSESVIGNAISGKRDKVLLATKMHVGAHTSADTMMTTLELSLKNLQTDYVDVFFNHAVNDIERLKNDEWFNFLEKAKNQGKLRFSGISGHAGNLAECVSYGLDQDMLDVILVATNFGQDPKFHERFTRSFDFVANQQALPSVMARAHKMNVGVIAMKVLRGARLNDMRPFEQGDATFAQAAFRWILQDASVDAAIISMTSKEQIDEYLGGSGGLAATEQDYLLLEQYARMTDLTYCRHACNDCEGSCPFNVPIADVLRTRMYATDYGDIEFAKSEYASLSGNASACLSCDGSPCQNSCSHGLNIAKLCGPTHVMLG